MKILNAKDLLTLSIEVTEEIASKDLLEFIRNSILNSELPFSKKSYFSFSYIQTTQTYEVIVYEKEKDFLCIEPSIFVYFFDQENKLEETIVPKVIFTKSYFALFIDDRVVLVKPMEELVQEDIEQYIIQIYKIEIFNIQYFDDDMIALCKKEFLQNHSFECIFNDYPLYKKQSFTYFAFFCVSMTLGVGSYFYIQQETDSSPIKREPQKQIVQSIAPKKAPIYTLSQLFSSLVAHNVTIDKISYAKYKISTVLYSKKKKNILDFISEYTKNIMIKSFHFNKMTNMYSLEVIIEI